MIDSAGLDTFRRVAEYSASAEIKFIAYDPFYYQVGGPEIISTTTAIDVASTFQINNIGSEPCFPSFNVIGGEGSEYITISLLDSDGITELKTITINNLQNVTINMLSRTVYSSVPPAPILNVFSDMVGEFWSIPAGVYYIKILSDAVCVVSTSTHFRWL
jgi:hypothetical protein